MEYAPRQFVHMLGIAVLFLLAIWGVGRWYQEEQSSRSVVDVRQYTWLASMNMRESDRISKPLIKSGEVAMLVVSRADQDVLRLNRRRASSMGADPALALFHFDRDGDALIDVTDPMFAKLFILSYQKGQAHFLPLAQSQLRAIAVHRQGDAVRYSAILSGGIRWPMRVAPEARPYSPMLDG